MLADTWLRGLKGFDAETAYRAMVKSATAPSSENILRTDNDDYLAPGLCAPARTVRQLGIARPRILSGRLALSRFAADLGHKEDAKLFADRSLGYKRYYCKEYGTLRPILPDGKFYTPFDPMQGINFEPVARVPRG